MTKEIFVPTQLWMLFEMAGINKKSCPICRKKAKVTLSGRLKEKCPIHPDQYLWMAGTSAEWEKARSYIKESFNPITPFKRV